MNGTHGLRLKSVSSLQIDCFQRILIELYDSAAYTYTVAIDTCSCSLTMHSVNEMKLLTRFNGAVDVRSGLVVDPVETSFNREPRQHSVLCAITIARCHIDGSSLVMQRIRRVFAIFVPAFSHPQLYPWPLVHHRDRQGIELLLASL